jgi:hypothetical protein
MYVHLYVSPSAAVRAGKTSSGLQRLDLTQEQLTLLTQEERDELARSAGLGSPQPPDDASRHSFLGRDYDTEVSEASFDSLRTVLQSRVAKRQSEQADKAKRTAEQTERVTAWLATYQRLSDTELLATKLDWLSGVDGAPYALREAATAVRRRQERLQEEAKAAASTAELERHLAAATLDAALRLTAEEGLLQWERTELARERHGEFPGAAEGPLERLEAFRRQAAQEVDRRNQALKAERAEAIRVAVTEWGTDSQRRRHAANLLPAKEALALVRDRLFAGISQPRYTRLEAKDVMHEDTCSGPDISFEAGDEEALTEKAFDAFESIQKHAPKEATVKARYHSVWCDAAGCEDSERVNRATALVTLDWHGYRFSREYALD